MNINFNNVRIKACRSYNNLVEKLNKRLDEPPLEDDEMVVYASDIQGELDSLRNLLISIACSYDVEGSEDFKDVSDEVGEFLQFNPEGK